MIRQPMTMFCYTDIAAQVRGKGFPRELLAKRLSSGIAWTPTNIMITSLGPIADTPWGPFGDLTMKPDRGSEVYVDFQDDSPAEHFFLCDIETTDGDPWDCCPRHALRTVLTRLRNDHGVVPKVSFEHEFVYSGAQGRTGDGYALDAIRRHGELGEVLLAALKQAGLNPDSYLPEYGDDQFEITLPPQPALKAGDEAMILRELTRAAAWRLGETVTFAPRCSPDGLGNGVHIHVSLSDVDGRPISYDPEAWHGVSKTAQHFLAGIQQHMPALCAVTAPTPTSYMRLVPHTWSAAWTNIGYRDREAGVRICPTFASSPRTAADQFNFEFRPADATGNPYLQMAALFAAGLDGLDRKAPMSEPTQQDPETLSETERHTRGIARLPQSLSEALDAWDADQNAQEWFPAALRDAYQRYKRTEIDLTKDLDPHELCRRYTDAF